ncbi:MAG: flagellar motor switch protein FliN [Bryobacteraceae bacterium]|nr:flagellar motor switch protein FliN [Solibacteraceae bacterium]MCO5352924.1 flagellar motor switch protein FliN [Bryobacteraceae bacterium]
MQTSTEWLIEKWAGTAGPALAALTGLRLQAAAGGGCPPAELAGAVAWRQETDAAPGSVIWVTAGPTLWRRLGQAVLTAAGLDDAADDEIRGSYLEALQQALSTMAPLIGSRAGREVNLLPGRETDAGSDPGMEWTGLHLSEGADDWGCLYVAYSPELEEVLGSDPTPAPVPEAGDPPPAHQNGPAGSEPAARAIPGSRTLDLLLEVELPVGVSFGRTQMRVKDAIKLTTGSIVELNRSVSAPVEIIVNNCVIARGEVVVVEGNYGVRIQEIVSREERLRTLF